jgi:menaquinone-specific isochorismate synthase
MNEVVARSLAAAPGAPPLAAELAARAHELLVDGREAVFDTPIGEVAPLTVLAWVPDDAVYWSGPDGTITVGFGVSAHLVASGRGRFHELGVASEEFFARIDTSACVAPVRLHVGCSFHDDLATDGRWEGFAAADATLPAVSLVREDGAWFIRIAVTRRTVSPVLAGQIRRVLRAVESARPARTGVRREQGRRAADAYPALVDDVVDRIASGEAEKIVAARLVEVKVDEPLEDALAVARLTSAYPDCHIFAFRRQGATFLGATPEPLLQRRGLAIRTVALAGSAPATSEGEETLRQSVKDAAEHAHVVEHLRSGLGPFCSELHVAGAPRIRRLRHIVHLETPVEGTLRAPFHILRMVSALHPTPAVGGVPRETAMSWIEEREGADRGWYSGPVGWFTADGAGDVAVAIRSGLIRGSAASLWAGAGIVRGSDAALEDAETLQKLRPLLYAIGVEE